MGGRDKAPPSAPGVKLPSQRRSLHRESTENTQIVHARLVEGLRPDNPLAQAPYLAAPFSLSTPGGMAALNAEVTRQAAMVAYVDDFKLIMLIALASLPLLLLLREGRRRPPSTAVVATAAADE